MVEGEEEVAAEDILARPRLRDETSQTEAGQREILSEKKLYPRSESLSKIEREGGTRWRETLRL